MMLGLSLGQCVVVRQEVALRQMVGETSGDIPLYSLHRIKNLFRKQPPTIDGKLKELLLQNLIAANRDYKEASGNDWSCLTSQNLVDAIDETDREIAETIRNIHDIPREYAAVKDKILAKLNEAREANVAVMKQWFDGHFDDLFYNMDGKIPWPVVCQLRRSLGQWIAGHANPFDQDIEDMVLEVADHEGISAANAEDAWESMGGTVFTKHGKAN
jgi:hypothetical protein